MAQASDCGTVWGQDPPAPHCPLLTAAAETFGEPQPPKPCREAYTREGEEGRWWKPDPLWRQLGPLQPSTKVPIFRKSSSNNTLNILSTNSFISILTSHNHPELSVQPGDPIKLV